MKFKLITFVFCVLLMATFVVAEIPSLKEVERGNCITLKQKYANSTYTNITTITYPNETEQLVNIAMSGSGGIWNYEFCNTNQLGDYEYCTRTDVDGVDTDVCIDFEVTPSGQGGNSNIVFSIFIILILLGMNLFGFFGKNIPLTILSGMALLFLGIYTINEGIIIYQDTLTNYLAYLFIGWGFTSAAWAILEQLDIL